MLVYSVIWFMTPLMLKQKFSTKIATISLSMTSAKPQPKNTF